MPETVEISAELVHETDSAYLIDDAGKRIWLPKSQCEYDGKTTFELAYWLALDKGLI